uniref:Mediator of RNA polymerase II transcription subunit 15 n=1 Tax=Sinocyclocheilus anshuiensis TaxID=1608454 RepID=A0A671R6X3_9TELE
MEVIGPDSDWRSPAFRQKVVAQIDEAMRKAGTAHTKSSTDMENHVFIKAKTRVSVTFKCACYTPRVQTC